MFMDLGCLIAAGRNKAVRLGFFQPDPLKDRRFVQGGRGIGVVFQQLGGAHAVIGKVHPAIKIPFPISPAIGDIVPVGLGNAQSPIDGFVVERLVQQLETHGVDLFRRPFQIVLDLPQGKLVIGGFIPIRHANIIAELVAMGAGRILQARTPHDGNAMHLEI